MSKICSKCLQSKLIEAFTKDKYKKSGYSPQCTACRYAKKTENKEQVAKSNKTQREKRALVPITMEMLEKRRKYHRDYSNEKRKTDIQFKLGRSIRTRFNHIIKGNVKSGSSVKDLGCSLDFLKTYLESKFQPGMSWDNYGVHGWHIDHVVPLSLFDLTQRDQLLKAVNYTNLQPLWAIDNLRKSNKVA